MKIDHLEPVTAGRVRSALGSIAGKFSIEALCGAGEDALIRSALESSGKLAQRDSTLKPMFMFWFTLGLTIFRSDAIPALFDRLVMGLRGRAPWLPLRAVTDGALVKARKRLGVEPFRLFFRALTAAVPRAPTFFGWHIAALDGVRLAMPDTPGNVRDYGRHRTGRGRVAAFPQLLVTMLHDVQTRQPLDAEIDDCKGSEVEAARKLIGRSVGPGTIVLIDRGFCGLPLLRAIRANSAHFLVRASSVLKLVPKGGKKAKRTGDYKAVMRCRVLLEPGDARPGTRGPIGKTKPVELEVRVIEYAPPGFRRIRLVTDIMDETIPPEEFIKLYHRRWEIEISFDEAKTTQLSTAKGTLATELRSKTPTGVLQETYALLTSYALLRKVIAEAAEPHDLLPANISFTEALRVIKCAITAMLGARGDLLPELRRQLLEDLARCKLDRPCRRRRYPRTVKRRVSRFGIKRRHHRAQRHVDPVEAFRGRRERMRLCA